MVLFQLKSQSLQGRIITGEMGYGLLKSLTGTKSEHY